MKGLHELIHTTDSAWPLLQEWVAASGERAVLLPVDELAAQENLLALQVTTRSVLGTVAYHTGGILLQHGWLRILGAGGIGLPRSLKSWNRNDAGESRLPSALLVADDVLGGFFAVNGGAFEGKPGEVFYFAPDTLEWENLEIPYSAFIEWACTGDLDMFYETFRWEGWEEEVGRVPGDQGILVYPFLCAEGGPIISRSRSQAPLEEMWRFQASRRE